MKVGKLENKWKLCSYDYIYVVFLKRLFRRSRGGVYLKIESLKRNYKWIFVGMLCCKELEIIFLDGLIVL